MAKPVPVIINASAGVQHDGAFASDLERHFKSAGVEAAIAMVDPADIAAEVQRAISAKPPVIVIGGGDGTLSGSASAFVGAETALGILPLGTLNHFAKDLHIPLDLEGAIQTIADGQTAKVDLGAVNDRFFLNNSSLGLYPKVVAGRDALGQGLGRRRQIG